MGDLDRDTALAGADGHYTASLSEDWRIWGPNGGYVAAIALRAAGAASRFRRPVSFACHFLGVGAFAPAEVAVTPLRTARAAESLRVVLAQEGRPFLEAQVWTGEVREGFVHDFATPPEVPPPHALRPLEEVIPAEEAARRHRFWSNFEARPTEDWVPPAAREPEPPRLCCWYRYVPTARFDDPFVEAARALILVDTLSWPAVRRAHPRDDLPWIAPSLDLAARFHRAPSYGEWLLVEASADVADEGLIGFHNRVWHERGRLVASGGGQLLCRRAPAPAG